MSSSFSEATDLETLLARLRKSVAMRPEQTLAEAEALLRTDPDARLFRIAAEACRQLELAADAESAELAAIQAALGNKALAGAAQALHEGRDEDALAVVDRFRRDDPDDALALTIGAEAQINLWRLDEAERALRLVLGRAPSFLRASMLLATCLAKQLRVREACTLLAQVVERKPNNVAALTYLAQLQAELGDIGKATGAHERLAALRPGKAEPWVMLAQYRRIAGDRQLAVQALREALAREPANGSAWWTLANYFPDALDEADDARIRQAAGEQAGSVEEGALHLALGLIADRRGEHEAAFEHFSKGKAVRLAHAPYDPRPISQAVDEVIRLFAARFAGPVPGSGVARAAPVFIIGMPRSGTTMVERILGQHSQLEGAGELPVVPRVAEKARRGVQALEHYGALLQALTADDLQDIAQQYARGAAEYRRSQKPRLIDKNNLNWMHLGLILLALPDARILDVRRDALDCCWSNFKMLFAHGFPAANHLAHVGQFYADYARMVDALHAVAPERILKIRYENVVMDIEIETRRMLNFLELPFEPQCLDFHLADGAVATASSEQVRRPLNRDGLKRWKPYDRWLGPLKSALGTSLRHDALARSG